jgi:hypothetical protein
MRYIAKPVEVEAVEWTGELSAFPSSWRALDMLTLTDGVLIVRTNRGPTPARIGDWVIRGRTGEFYPIDPATFADKYEAVD